MTHYTEFEKAVKHVKACLFWDFIDGVWNDVIVTPLDRNYFNRLMQQMSDAHAREVEAIKSENAKLRELVLDYFNAPCLECNPWAEGWEGCKHCESGNCTLAVRTLELGIEVDG